VYIVKPAYTATPVQLAQANQEVVTSNLESPVSTPNAVSSEAASTQPTESAPALGLLQAVIVDDGSVPENSASAPDVPPAYSGNKYVLVDISDQYMYVYEGDTLIQSFIASTGMRNATRVGTFSVLDKIPNAYGSTWDIWMPNWLGIYYAGGSENGIHALPILSNGATLWEGYLGTPISYGCVVLGTYDSQWLYDWAEIGTPVEIRR
jgi:lipoprotein-anchoring transpeptidase ErfK/SrfK